MFLYAFTLLNHSDPPPIQDKRSRLILVCPSSIRGVDSDKSSPFYVSRREPPVASQPHWLSRVAVARQPVQWGTGGVADKQLRLVNEAAATGKQRVLLKKMVSPSHNTRPPDR